MRLLSRHIGFIRAGIAFFVGVILLSFPGVDLFGQAQITTRREKLGDFTLKTMKVVLSGNEQRDDVLREAIRNSWSISPWEVCSKEDYQKLRTDPKYYFMVQDSVTQKGGDPGIIWVRIAKGTAGAKKTADLLEMTSFPLCAADSLTGRESAFLPALLDIVQSHIENSLLSKVSKNISPTRSMSKAGKKRVYFVMQDIAQRRDCSLVEANTGRGNILTDLETQSSVMRDGLDNSLVTYTIVPFHPVPTSLCYRLVIDAKTHELYFLKKGSVGSDGVGFTHQEVSSIVKR